MNLIDDITEDAEDVDCSLTFFKIDCGLFLHGIVVQPSTRIRITVSLQNPKSGFSFIKVNGWITAMGQTMLGTRS